MSRICSLPLACSIFGNILSLIWKFCQRISKRLTHSYDDDSRTSDSYNQLYLPTMHTRREICWRNASRGISMHMTIHCSYSLILVLSLRTLFHASFIFDSFHACPKRILEFIMIFRVSESTLPST